MKARYVSILLAFLAPALAAQTTLLQENFDACGTLPSGWQVSINGNQNAVWYVGTPLNNDSDSMSIDGTCMLIIDDDATGNNTPAFVLDVVSPAFDASGFTTVNVEADIHYRDHGPSAESFQVLVTDGATTVPVLTLAQNQSTGSQFSKFKHYRFDLAFAGMDKPNVRLIFRYDDAAGFAWWAGFDNLRVTGSGSGDNIMLETFNDCVKPAGWETQIVTGNTDWKFAPGTNPKYNGITTMDGTCFAWFDDDVLGAAAPYAIARLYTPWIDGRDYARFELQFDLIHRYVTETFTVLVENGAGEEFPVASWAENVGGPYYNNYERITLDLSPYRHQQMRVVFQYDDGRGFAWWTGVDNVKLSGDGPAIDVCANAVPLLTGAACSVETNHNMLLDGPAAPCAVREVSGRWFTWTADFSGHARLRTRADFNDVVTVFTGDCSNLQPVACNNRDEHGFTGETTWFVATAGETYKIRVAGEAGGFGSPRGNFCLQIESVPSLPATPANEACQNAVPLAVDATDCTPGQNRHAATDLPVPTHDTRARADVWYSFVAPALSAGERLEISSGSDFSEIITVYAGGCNALSQLATNPYGGKLALDALAPGETCHVQIAGLFATLEGGVCVRVRKVSATTPPNEGCLDAATLTVGGACMPGSTLGAATTTYTPLCAVYVGADVWYKFVAPASGSIQVNTGADFEHVAAVWKGTCAGLTPHACFDNPQRCDGYFVVGNLVPGTTYYLQIAATAHTTGFNPGSLCVRLLDGAEEPDYEPLQLAVSQRCTGAGLAELLMTASGGEAPYTFGGTGVNFTSGQAFISVVTDARGCVRTVEGIIGECTEAYCQLAALFNAVAPACHGGTDGVLSVMTTGGLPPYSYQWSAGNGSTTPAVDGLAAGLYYVTVTDGEGCSVISAATLSEPDALLSTLGTVVKTDYAQNNGSIATGASGGTAPYTYAWQRNGQAWPGNAPDLQNLPAGAYALTVTDAHGCTAALTAVVDENDPPCAVSASVTAVDATCNGAADGTVAASATAGQAPFTYLWSNAATGASLTGLTAGVYFVTVTDAWGCTVVSLGQVTEPTVLTATPGLAINPDFAQSNGSINTAAGGGTPPYQYAWTRDGVAWPATTPDLQNLPAGAYALVVTDANGCTAALAVILTENPLVCVMTAALAPTNVACHGNADGSLTAAAANGTAPFTYAWSTGATTATPTLAGLGAGTYTVAITDAYGCTAEAAATIEQPTSLASLVDGLVDPNAGMSNGEIQVSTAGGTPPYQYTWTRDGVALSAGTEDLYDVPAGAYALTVTDAHGCTAVVSIELQETVGADDPQQALIVDLLPNPANESTVVRLALPAAGDVQLAVLDAAGRVIENRLLPRFTKGDVRLDVRKYPAALYQVTLTVGERTAVRTLVIER